MTNYRKVYLWVSAIGIFYVEEDTEIVLKVYEGADPEGVGGETNLGIFLYVKDADGDTAAIVLHPDIFPRQRQGVEARGWH